VGVERSSDERRGSMFTVHRASTGADWREATALLYDYVEWVRGWTGIDPVVERPQLHTELACMAAATTEPTTPRSTSPPGRRSRSVPSRSASSPTEAQS
jgi:hypothetical protein